MVRGSYLTRVEICAVPSGTGIDPNRCGLLGLAKRITAAGQREKWVLPIPDPPTSSSGLLVTEIYAKGYDEFGRVIGRTSLPYGGVSAVADAVWEHADPKVFSKVYRIELG
jgi:hypothetical protein